MLHLPQTHSLGLVEVTERLAQVDPLAGIGWIGHLAQLALYIQVHVHVPGTESQPFKTETDEMTKGQVGRLTPLTPSTIWHECD